MKIELTKRELSMIRLALNWGEDGLDSEGEFGEYDALYDKISEALKASKTACRGKVTE